MVSDGNNTFVWFNGSTSFLFVTQTTSYAATAYSSCAQAVSFSFTIEVEVSVYEMLQREFAFWPNPVNDRLTLELPMQ